VKNTILNATPKSIISAIHSCSPFHLEYETFEEKKTDVNIALDILKNAYKDNYDKAIIITGDNDISPALKEVKKEFPHKELVVIFPLVGKGNSLKKICDKSMVIQKSDLHNSLLTDPVN
jgi:uncharacterized LabA/DUF88 family protein